MTQTSGGGPGGGRVLTAAGRPGRRGSWRSGFVFQQEAIDQVRYQPGIGVVVGPLVLRVVPVYLGAHHTRSLTIGDETNDVNAETGPAPVDVQSLVMPAVHQELGSLAMPTAAE